MSKAQEQTAIQVSDDSKHDMETFTAVYDEEEVVDEKPRSLLFEIVKQLVYGMDLTRVTRLKCILYLLFFDFFAFFCILVPVFISIKMDDPVARITYITRFYLSGFHIRSRKVRKPFNSVLGEYFRCYWDLPDGSRTWYLAEQVSHHPPISAFYFENVQHHYSVTGHVRSRSTFTGNSSGAYMVGNLDFHLWERDEVYSFKYPRFVARGVLMGKMRMETCGEGRMECLQTGLEAIVNFREKPSFGGVYNTYELIVRHIPDSKQLAPPPRQFKDRYPQLRHLSLTHSSFQPTERNPWLEKANRAAGISSSSSSSSPSDGATHPIDKTRAASVPIPEELLVYQDGHGKADYSTVGWAKYRGFKEEKKTALISGEGDWTDCSYVIDQRPEPTLPVPQEYVNVLGCCADNIREIQAKKGIIVRGTGKDEERGEGGAGSSSSSSSSPSPVPLNTKTGAPADASEKHVSTRIKPEDLKPSQILYFDVQNSPFASKCTISVPQQDPFESRVVWDKVTKAMRVLDYDTATKEKSNVENEGRRRAKERVRNRVCWRQRFFHFDPIPRSPEDVRHQPDGRWRMNYEVTCYSPDEEKNPATRTITCYNVPDQNNLFAQPVALTDEMIKKDEDNQCSFFYSLQDAIKILGEKKKDAAGAKSGGTQLTVEQILGPKWPMGPPSSER